MWLVSQIDEPSAAGIASSIARLIRDGSLAPGTALPPVRNLAKRLHVGSATVSAAWRTLREQRLVEGGGRAGIRVSGPIGGASPSRYENVSKYWREGTLNLSRATPDPALLPDFAPALQSAMTDPDLHSYELADITPALRAAVEPTWPFEPEALLCSRGGYDALFGLITTSIVAGDYVAVQEPSTARTLDLLDQARARVIPVPVDESGPRPEALQRAMALRPAMFIYEPRSSSWASSTMTVERRQLIADILAPHDVLIVEDDPWSTLCPAPYAGVGALLPHRTVLIHSFAKSHSPDLRVGVLGGANAPIERVRVYRHFGDGWTSRILQNTLAHLLCDDEARARIEHARSVYDERNEAFRALLADRGVVAERCASGLAVLASVAREDSAALVLASHGIATLTAGDCWSGRSHPSVRLRTALELEDPERIADVVAQAARAR